MAANNDSVMVERNLRARLPGTDWHVAGIVDMYDNGVLVDYKSTSSLTGWLERNTMSLQPDIYMWLLMSNGHKVTGFQYRVCAKPGIRYCGKDASPAEYLGRCRKWLSESGGYRVFDMPVSANRIESAVKHLARIAKQIEANRESKDWLTNHNACGMPGRAICPFVHACASIICGARIDLNECFIPAERREGTGTDTPNTLRASSASDFLTCQMLYYYKHEMRLAPRQDEYSEALSVGTAYHRYLSMSADDARAALDGDVASIGVGPGNLTKRVAQDYVKAFAMAEYTRAKEGDI